LLAAFKMAAVAPMSRISYSFTPNQYILRARCVRHVVRGMKGVLTDVCLTGVLTDLCLTGVLTDVCLTGVLTDLCLTRYLLQNF